MITDFQNSVRAILRERTTSPFYGALIVSWIGCNWKIVYLTLFIDQQLIKPQTKIQYIIENYFQIENLLWYPLIFTASLLTVVSLLSNGFYWLSLQFEYMRLGWKESKDQKRRITFEQYAALKQEMDRMDENFKKTFVDKESELTNLRNKVAEYEGDLNSLKILSAWYGSPVNGWQDVTQMLNYEVQKNRRLKLTVSNDTLAGDPAEGSCKDFVITYRFKGVVRSEKAVEGDSVLINIDGSYRKTNGSIAEQINEALKQKSVAYSV